jgi:molybdenum cofactor cytidylyltransferase
MDPHVAGLVIAAGSSKRLGQPKQLLPYRGATLLDASLEVARRARFAQRIVTVGGAGDAVRERVDLSGFDVVDSVRHTEGCSSSIVTALQTVEPDTDGIVLLLGDQPGVGAAAIDAVVAVGASGADIAVCVYDDGIGHPFWFGSRVFGDLGGLHGDKAVWKLIESGRYEVHEVPVAGPVPPDVDTWADYERLLTHADQP